MASITSRVAPRAPRATSTSWTPTGSAFIVGPPRRANSPPSATLPLDPVNLAVDQSRQPGGRLLRGQRRRLYRHARQASSCRCNPKPLTAQTREDFFLPVSDWRLNRDSLSRPAAHFLSPDGTTVLPAGADFLSGAMSWGVKSSPPNPLLRPGAGRMPGQTFLRYR